MLAESLHNYIFNVLDPKANFDLGWDYEQEGQTGAAVGFYLRAAEKTDNVELQYECLLRCALCLERQTIRDDSEKVLLQKAMNLMPRRPEAYFLISRLLEKLKTWQEGYTYAALGLDFCDFDLAPLSTDVEYPGRYGLIFEKGVCAWWIGYCSESQEIMNDLQANYEMNDVFANAVDKNLDTIGYPLAVNRYSNKIRFKFNGIETVEENYAQTFQDMFVLAATNGKREGTYLEIGSAEPFLHNNTALLETKFAWRGASIDIKRHHVEDFNRRRENLAYCLDATNIDYAKFLRQVGLGPDIDYLQLDCEPPSRTYDILEMMPFDTYRFAVITFEHDHYVDPTVRDKSREYLKSKGYRLIASDIGYDETHSYEDWWVHPELVDAEIQEKLLDLTPGAKYAKTYLFPKR